MALLVDQEEEVVQDLLQEQEHIIMDQDVQEQVILLRLLLHKVMQVEQDI